MSNTRTSFNKSADRQRSRTLRFESAWLDSKPRGHAGYDAAYGGSGGPTAGRVAKGLFGADRFVEHDENEVAWRVDRKTPTNDEINAVRR